MDTTTHYQLPNGDLVTVTVSEGLTYDVPDDTVALTEEEFTPLLAAAEAARAAHVADLEEADQARGREVYDALISEGISPLLASLLARYTPPDHDHDHDH